MRDAQFDNFKGREYDPCPGQEEVSDEVRIDRQTAEIDQAELHFDDEGALDAYDTYKPLEDTII